MAWHEMTEDFLLFRVREMGELKWWPVAWHEVTDDWFPGDKSLGRPTRVRLTGGPFDGESYPREGKTCPDAGVKNLQFQFGSNDGAYGMVEYRRTGRVFPDGLSEFAYFPPESPKGEAGAESTADYREDRPDEESGGIWIPIRYRRLRISTDLLCQMLRDGTGMVEVARNPLPGDATIVNAYIDVMNPRELTLVIESRDYSETMHPIGSDFPLVESPMFVRTDPMEPPPSGPQGVTYSGRDSEDSEPTPPVPGTWRDRTPLL